MLQEFFAYVDEAGDEGFGKLRLPGGSGQTRWLCLGAIIASKANDPLIPSWRNEVISLFGNKYNQSDIHFRRLNHNQKIAACQKLAGKPLGICVIASNKETILDSSELEIFKEKQHLYNYLVRFLVERLTTACVRKANGAQASLHITFSRRSGTDYQAMREYFEFMRAGKEKLVPKRSIDWRVFDPVNIRVENHSVRAGLQIADVVTSATFSALEPDIFGNTEPRYSLCMKQRYLRQNGKIANNRLTLIPATWDSPLSENQKQYLVDIEKK